MKLAITVLAFLSFISGCASPNGETGAGLNNIPMTERAFKKNLSQWTGKHVDAAISEWGQPFYVSSNAYPGNKTYKFQMNPTVLEIEDEKFTVWCDVGFNVNAEGIIRGAGYSGPNCKAPDYSKNAYGGPTAQIQGIGRIVGPRTMLYFEIMDAPKLPHACEGENFPIGHGVPARCVGDEIPAQPMRVRLRASLSKWSPYDRDQIVHLAEGVVSFKPGADKSYRVTGESSDGRTSVWIEDVDTHQPVTEKISSLSR